MSHHLPECWFVIGESTDYVNHIIYTYTAPSNGCICKRLRQAEQRGYERGAIAGARELAAIRPTVENWANAVGKAHDEGYADALGKARDAVTALLPSPGDHPLIDLRDALAAIDALRSVTP